MKYSIKTFSEKNHVQEAIEFTGLFIQEGPVGIMESKSRDQPYTMYDGQNY